MSLNQLPLFKELSFRGKRGDDIAEYLAAKLITLEPHLRRALEDVRVFYRHFTDHSINHSFRIIKNIGSFLKGSTWKYTDEGPAVLTSVDIFLIIGAALSHDLGMIIREVDIKKLEGDIKFHKFLESWKKEYPFETQNDWCCRGIPRFAVAEYIRRYHAKVSMKMILNEEIYTLDMRKDLPDLVRLLGEISAAHGMDFEDICSGDKFPTRREVGTPNGQSDCNPRFVALCLRIGDLLDISTSRACPILWHLSEPLPVLSEDHWKQYEAITIDNLSPNSEISISGECPTQEAERLLRDWCRFLEKESLAAMAIQNQDKEPYRFSLGRILCKVKPVEIAGKRAYEFLNFRFNLDEKIVFERLFGSSLYGHSELALRELIQNSIDAQRTKIVYEVSQTPNWNSLESKVRNERFREALKKKKNEMPIKLSISNIKEKDSSQIYRWLTISDQGIGMSRDTIQKFLLKVGRSRWGEDPTISKFGIGSFSIGTFGIGFISTFMIADRIIISTKSCLPHEEGIKATIYGWQGYLATEEELNCAPGTTIAMRLNSDLFLDKLEVAQSIAEIAPLTEFPLLLSFEDSKDILIPSISRGILRKKNKLGLEFVENHEGKSFMDFDNEGSLLAITEKKFSGWSHRWDDNLDNKMVVERLCKDEKPIIVSQDGLTLGEMVFPQDNSPESKVLTNYRVLLDIHGKSRIPLALSRNLPEVGISEFWKTWVPKIWDRISGYFSADLVVRGAIAELTKSEIFANRPESFRFLASGPKLIRRKNDLSKIKHLVCIDSTTSKRIVVTPEENFAVFVLPPSDAHPFVILPLANVNAVEGNSFEAISNMPFNPHLFDGAMLGEGTLGFEERCQKIVKYGRRINLEWNSLMQTYKEIFVSEAGDVTLAKEPLRNSISIEKLIAFRVTMDWLCLRNPKNGNLCLMPAEPIKNLYVGRGVKKLSPPDTYLFLMKEMFPGNELREWGTEIDGEIGERLAGAADTISKRESNASNEKYDLYLKGEGEYWDEDEESDDPEEDFLEDQLEKDFGEVSPLYKGVAKKSFLVESVPVWDKF